MIELSEHFCQQWQKYFDEEAPPPAQVLHIIRRAIWIQRCKVLYEADGTAHKQLGTYWDPEKGIIIKIDWIENKAVTVITRKTKKIRQDLQDKQDQNKGQE